MGSTLLNVLRDSIGLEFTILRNTINIDLDRTVKEFSHDNGMIGRNVHGFTEELVELLTIVCYIHGSTGKNVGRTNQDGISVIIAELVRIVHARESTPSRLFHTNLVKHRGVLVTILTSIDHLGMSSQNVHTVLMKFQSHVVRSLTSNRHDRGFGTLNVDNIHDTLVTDLLEVKSVTLIIIRRHSLGIVVQRNGLLTQLS